MFRLLKVKGYLPLSILLSIVFVVAGIFIYAKTLPIYWGGHALGDFLSWVVGCYLLAWIAKHNFEATARPFCVGALAIYLAFGVGLIESATILLFIISAALYGRSVIKIIFPNENKRNNCVDQYFIVGLATHLAIFGFLIHFEVNYRLLYFTILIAPIIIIFVSKQMVKNWRDLSYELNGRIGVFYQIPYWNFVLMLILIGLVARYSFFPTIGYDDNALHLGMWTQLTHKHIYSFDVVGQIWAVAPFAVAILHSIVSMLAGSDTRSALNILLFVLLLRQIWLIGAQLKLEQQDRLLTVVLFASTPMIGNLLVTLQTELFLAFLAASGVKLMLGSRKELLTSENLAIVAIAAMCSASKLPGAILGLLILAAGAVLTYSSKNTTDLAQTRSKRIFVFLFLLVLTFVALNSYITAWWITGNPIFPLYNKVFRSEYYEYNNFSDLRYVKGFSLESYWNVFFNTSQYFESKNFVAGFQYLFLLPIGLAVMWRIKTFNKQIVIFLPLLGFGLIMFGATQYWRYIFPILPLAVVVIGHMLVHPNRDVTFTSRLAIGACIAINFYFYPGISWFFGVGPQYAYTIDGKQKIEKKFAPTKVITEYINKRYEGEGSRVLYSDEPYGASLLGQPIYTNWYSPNNNALAKAVKHPADIAAFLKTEKIGFVVWNQLDSSLPNEFEWVLREYLSQYGYPEFHVGNHVLYRILEKSPAYLASFDTDENSPSFKNIKITQKPQPVAKVHIDGALVARYQVDFGCKDSKGFFIAQVNWNIGNPYYRTVRCSSQMIRFSESFRVPAGATQAEVIVTALDTPLVSASRITLETY